MKLQMMIAWMAVLASLAWAGQRSAGADGREERIVFASNRSGAFAIWAMKPDGTGAAQLSKPGKEEQDVDPCASGDGKSILFTSTRGGKAGIWRMAADGTKPERICDGDQGEWSLDGSKIVLRRAGALIVRDIKSGEEITITPKGWTTCSGPAWSPDGQTIAFARLEEGANAVYVVSSKGGEPTKVYGKQGACEPHWSPDGKRLIYETEAHLCTINPDGTRNRLLTTFGGVQRYGRFSPDGSKVVFCQAASPEGPWELYVIPATGGAPVRVTEGGSDLNPDWR